MIAPDVDPPETAVEEPTVKNRSVEVRFLADEQGSTFECRLDQAEFASCSSPKTYRRLKRGKHRFFVRATDIAGNLEDKPDKVSFRIG